MTQLVTIAIPTWNRAALLRQTLQQMNALRGVADGNLELLVINNNCTDETASIVESFTGRLPIRMILERQAGSSHARNRAIVEAKGNYLLWADDDVLVHEQWLVSFRDAISRYPDAAVYGGPIEPWFVTPPDPQLVEAYPAVASGFCGLDYGTDLGPLRPDQEVFSANMGFNLQRLGGIRFDPRLGVSPTAEPRGEETNLIRTIVREGKYVVWVPAMRVKHYVDPSRLTLAYLEKFYRGRGSAYVQGTLFPPAPTLAGLPRWLMREVIEAYAQATLARLTGMCLPTSRRLHTGGPPRQAASRRVKVLTWTREFHWLCGAVEAYRKMGRASAFSPQMRAD